MSTIPGLLLETARKYPKPDAFRYKSGGHWIDVSTHEFVRKVEELFHGLVALGIHSGDRVAILSENRVEWAIADYAALAAGAIVVPLFPTLSVAQTEALLTDSETKLVFVSSEELLEKISSTRKRLRHLNHVVTFSTSIFQPGVMRLEGVYKIGRQVLHDQPGEFRARVGRLSPSDVATIIYTSGTTGVPRGAMLTHRNLVSNILASSEVLSLTEKDCEVSFLPLSHIFQRHVDYAATHAGATVAYAASPEAAADDISEIRPTFTAVVPRFLEKARARILAAIEHTSPMNRQLFHWALQIGERSVKSRKKGLLYAAADKIVFQKIRQKFGGRMRWFISGGAALEHEVQEFFLAIGLPVLEGYGLTETAPVIALSPPDQLRPGFVGRPVGDVEIRVADDGEIYVRGSNVMTGYFRKPRETQEALRDGWFHTGDVGFITDDGYLKVTDRKKDLIITSTGKKFAPQPVENKLRLIPYFDNVVLIGDGRQFISALIVPNIEAIARYARTRNLTFQSTADLLHSREIHDLAMQEIEKRTADLSECEKVKKVAFLEEGLTINGGELTPTLKVRRSVIENKFRHTIDELYAA